MPDVFWAVFPGGPNWRKWKRRWDREVAATERRLDARALEEAFLVAMRDTRTKREPTKPPMPNTSMNYVQPLVPTHPQASLVTVEDDDSEPATKPSLSAPCPRSATYTNRAADFALNRVGRYTSALNPAYIRSELHEDIRARGNFYYDIPRVKHPLHEQYEIARQRALDNGEPDPGGVGSIVLCQDIKHRIRWEGEQKNSRMTVNYEEGVYVQRGFALPKRWADFELQRVDSVASVVTVVQYHPPDLPRNRSNTFDDRLIGSTETLPADGDQDAEDEEDTASIAAMSVGSTPDPAESIAAYHDRRANYFGLDAEAGGRATRSL